MLWERHSGLGEVLPHITHSRATWSFSISISKDCCSRAALICSTKASVRLQSPLWHICKNLLPNYKLTIYYALHYYTVVDGSLSLFNRRHLSKILLWNHQVRATHSHFDSAQTCPKCPKGLTLGCSQLLLPLQGLASSSKRWKANGSQTGILWALKDWQVIDGNFYSYMHGFLKIKSPESLRLLCWPCRPHVQQRPVVFASLPWPATLYESVRVRTDQMST